MISSDESLVAINQGEKDGLDYTFAKDDEVITGGEFLIKNLKMNKVSVIEQEIGVKPVLCFGNSSGDEAMANFTINNNTNKSLAYMLCCDNTQRENGNLKKANKMLLKNRGVILMSYIKFENVSKIYKMGEIELKALDNASFEIEKGELVVILGPSGSGKSTCLNILGGMDDVTSGNVIVDGQNIAKLKEKELINYRRKDIGFVFQFYNLIQNLTAYENIELGVQMCKNYIKPEEVLEKVGLSDKMDNFPSQMSGGQQQRVSIARAIARKPKMLLCDEPTGALDYKTGKQILKLLEETCRKERITVIIITHNGSVAPMADRVIKFKNGGPEDIIINKEPKTIDEIEW